MVLDNSEQLKKISNEVENLKLRTPVNSEIPGYESFLTKFELPLSTKGVNIWVSYLQLLTANVKQSVSVII